jgi:hypothetical protein
MDRVKFHLKFRRNFGLERNGPSGHSKESCIARLVTELPQDRLHAQVGTLQTLSQPCLDPYQRWARPEPASNKADTTGGDRSNGNGLFGLGESPGIPTLSCVNIVR